MNPPTITLLPQQPDPMHSPRARELVAGRYRLESVLGEGGVGVVWGATDERDGARVALKMLKVRRGAENHRRRLLREARIAACLCHPSLAKVHDVVVASDGSPVLVMERLDGETLAARLASTGSLSVAEVGRVLAPVAAALQAAHAFGIAHRDVKPANIFLARGGAGVDVRLLDFGIAKLLRPDGPLAQSVALTRPGAPIGSPAYMAPEQVRYASEADARSDLWSLGIVLYECLTGKVPTQGASASAVLREVLAEDPPAIERLVPRIPPDLLTLVRALLVRDPALRQPDLHEAIDVLRRYAGLSPEPFAPLTIAPFAARSPRDEGLFEDIWSPPPNVDQFRLGRLLGSGAMGRVWLAHDTLLDRPVALKIAREIQPEEGRRRFLMEARAVAKLHHPNLLTVHHVGEIDQRPFLVTELLSGSDLSDLTLPLNATDVIRIGLDLTRGLAAAHRAGVLHRDIKPANAFLCDDGTAKILDFGLARFQVAEEPPTSSPHRDAAEYRSKSPQSSGLQELDEAGATFEDPDSEGLVGTPAYVPPEVWRGDPATRRSDVYSLGVLLYELLAGCPPFATGNIQAMRTQIMDGGRVPLVELAPDAPALFVELVDRCLSLQADARPLAHEVCEALQSLAAKPGEEPEGLADASENPYRGLLAFGFEHRRFFFGRESEVTSVLGELRASHFVLVAGASGAGKSSLIRAGVVPCVLAGALGAGGWCALTMIPGAKPLEALARAVASLLGVDEAEAAAVPELSPAERVARLRALAKPVLLVIDQLEEVWTLAPAAERAAFFDAVADLTRGVARVVATLRTDFLERVDDLRDLREQALRAIVLVGPMKAEALRRAVTLPAQRRGVAIETALVEQLIAAGEAGRVGAGALPLVAFALAELWERRDPSSPALTTNDLDALGGVAGALAVHADAVLAGLSPTHRMTARRLLLALVTIERTRARCEERELLTSEEGACETLEALVGARLVVALAGEHGAAYEVAHEALLSGWPTLRGWLDEEASSRAEVNRLRRAAAEWERLGRADDTLLGERRLRALEGLREAEFGSSEQAFVVASRLGVRRARWRRLRLRLGLPLVVLAFLGVVWIGIRFVDRRATRTFVAARLAEADRRIATAYAEDAWVERKRASAFARFDANDWSGGEAEWKEALEVTGRVSARFAEASTAVDRALARDPRDGGARTRAADLLFRWLLAAERDHQSDLVRDLRAHLATVDDDGSRRARLDAPSRLAVTTSPPGASVMLHPVRLDAQKHRVEGEGRPLPAGEPSVLEPGSYVLMASAPGRYATRYPVFLQRGEDQFIEIAMPAAASVPDGYVDVPAGESLLGAADSESIRDGLLAQPEHRVHVGAFLIARYEVTMGDYVEFLESLVPAERAQRRPRDTAVEIREKNGGEFTYVRENVVVARGEPYCRISRSVRRCQDWSRFPVVAISWDDASAYARWVAATRLPGARLCADREWERAARGADGRAFPHGDALQPGDANESDSYADVTQFGEDEVGSFPNDTSPLGVMDLTANASEMVSDTLDAKTPERHVARGSSWLSGWVPARTIYRGAFSLPRGSGRGARLCADPRP